MSSNRRGDRIAQRLLAKTWQFPSLFYEAIRIFQHLLKVAGAVEILNTFSGSSPVFPLSNHTTFSQTQTGATVPLNY
jgi:HD-like signal output (HDOD) protein